MSPISYLELPDLLAIACQVLELDELHIVKTSDLDSADSALHAPAAG